MNILITGGADFTGSAVIRHIINDTQDLVINVDKLAYAGNLNHSNLLQTIHVMLLSKLIFAIKLH